MSNAVTFLFTDIEGSTRLWEDHPEAMQEALEWHDRVSTRIVQRHGGKVFKNVGDALYAVFPSVRQAAQAAIEGQRRLSKSDGIDGFPLRVRMAIHTGPAQERHGDYFGASLNRLARLLGMGSGGQVLLTRAAREALLLGSALPGTMLVDLGVHRLRDVVQPEHVFELRIEGLSSDATPVRSLATHPNNLPVQISSFVGRDRELSDCRRMLRNHRLVTLIGVGGSGKTRLALQLAGELLAADGAYLIELAPLKSPSLAGQSIGDVFGLRETPDKSVIQVVCEHLRTKRTLLVIDNCEHMLGEATEVIRTLLERCPLLKVLATSREALGVQGEFVYKVPPLALPMSDRPPPVDVLAGFEAVRLFVDRAASAKGGFALSASNAPRVFDICRRLDGIPLAIELAAARVRSMTLEQIAERLDDQFRLLSGGPRGVLPRQQTLRALVDWSYDLLTADEKCLLDRLSVFVSGFLFEAVESVCGDPGIDAFDTLSRLVEKSLVQSDDQGEEPRYRLLETIRQYGWKNLVDKGEADAIRKRHLIYFEAFVAEAKAFVQNGDPVWLDRLSREHDNIRYALDHYDTSAGDVEHALRLAGAMTVFWNNRGHLTEARERFRELLARSEHAPGPLRADALLGAGVIEGSLASYERAVALGESAVQIWRDVGDEANLAFGLLVLGNVRIQLHDLEGAARDYEEGMLLRLRQGETERLAIPLNNLGYIAYQRGDYGKAQRMIEEAIRRSKEAGNRQIIVNATHSLAMVFKDIGQHGRALETMRESLSAAAELKHHGPIALRLEGVAYILETMAEDRVAARLIGAAQAIRERIAFPVPSLERPHHERHVASLRIKLGAEYEAERQRGAVLTEAQAVELALTCELPVA